MESPPHTNADNCKKRCHKEQQQQQQQQHGVSSLKRRRSIPKQKQATNPGVLETSDCDSSASGVGHSSKTKAVPRSVPKREKVHQPTFIAIDLETTDLIRDGVMPHITQVAAMVIPNGDQFAKYVQPHKPIALEAQRITGISTDDSGALTFKGETVNFVSIKKAIKKLCTWLQKFKNVILVAHYGKYFDFPILVEAVKKNQLKDIFWRSVSGMVDSLPVFKEIYPTDRSYKLQDLVANHLDKMYDAHNAKEDVKALGDLLESCEKSVLLNHIFSLEDL